MLCSYHINVSHKGVFIQGSRTLGECLDRLEKIITAIGGAAIVYKTLPKAGSGPWPLKPLGHPGKARGSCLAKRQALQNYCKAINDSVNQVSGWIADIGFDTEDATVGVTKLLDSLRFHKQLLTGAGALAAGRRVTRRPRAGRALTAWLLRSPGEGLLRPEAFSCNGPSSKCARRTRPCQTRASRSAECRFLLSRTIRDRNTLALRAR